MNPKKRKKHRHNIEWDEGCSKCGYQEGYCKKCDKVFGRDDYNSKAEEI